jgi:hypothetical protein
MHGKQSILLSLALTESNVTKATKAVICRIKSSRTAKAIEKIVSEVKKCTEKINLKSFLKELDFPSPFYVHKRKF